MEEETDETLFWLEVIEETNILKGTENIQKELNEILSIVVASIKTLRTKS